MSATGRHARSVTTRHGAGAGCRRRAAARDAPRRGRAGVVVALVSLLAAVAWALAGLPEARAAVQGWVVGPGAASGPAAVAQTASRPPAPGADGLAPELAARFASARAAAGRAGVGLEVVSGVRTRAEQLALVAEAEERYGSAAEAHRWVAPPEASAHLTGEAVDVGPADGRTWLAEHGAEFGLCQVFDNEPWHVEALVEPGGTCPATAPDASALWP